MLNLTTQERQIMLFLLCAILTGLGINFVTKNSPLIKEAVQVDERGFKIDINRVSYEELQVKRAVTPKLAKSIIEYRRLHGQFRSLEELKEIKGIGNYRYEKLKDLFLVE